MHAEGEIERLEDVKSLPRHPDRLIADVAAAQHGVVSRMQLLDRGLSRECIAGRLERGMLQRIHAGVYAVGHPAVGEHGRWMAAVLASGEGAVLARRSAAALWRIRSWRGPAEVNVPRSGGAHSLSRVKRLRGRLQLDEITSRSGISATGPSRTIFDLAAVLTPGELSSAIRESEILRLTDVISLPELVDRYPGRRGVAQLRLCLEAIGAIGSVDRTELEERFARLVARARLPTPRRNARIEIGKRTYEVDCLWERQRLVVELDGHGVHGTRSLFESDRDRDRRMQGAGWRVVRITWRHLIDRPSELVDDIRALLASWPMEPRSSEQLKYKRP